MANILDYIKWRGDLGFEQAAFNEVDGLILSQLSYLDFGRVLQREEDAMPLKEAAALYFMANDGDAAREGLLIPQEIHPMLKLLAKTRRFGNVLLSGYENHIIPERTEQFSAVTADVTDSLRIVSYRGTDDSIVGWKEDFNLATSTCVPAQKDALAYLLKAAEKAPKARLVTLGHSKGGNLSIYAASMAPECVRKRILRCWSYDGPGFRRAFLQEEGCRSLASRICVIRPANATVGVLMCVPGKVVHVNSSVRGLMAHSGFSWEVLGGRFVRAAGQAKSSKAFEQAMDNVLKDMSEPEIRSFADEFFGALTTAGSRTLMELSNLKLQDTLRVAAAMMKNEKIHSVGKQFAEAMFSAILSERGRLSLQKGGKEL